MEFHLSDSNTPLNAELRVFIESHFKYTIMNVKLIFRFGFGVKLQTSQILDGIGAGDFCASAKKSYHHIWIFVGVSKCMIG